MAKVMNENIKYPEMDVLTNEELCDVVFVVNGQTIKAHKQFLSVKSRIFRELFTSYNNLVESGQTVVPIEDTTYKAFKSFIHYLYCDELVIEDYNDLQLIENIARLSAKYKVFRLLDKICQHLKTTKGINESIIRLQTNENNVIEYPEFDYFMNEMLSDVVFIVDGLPVPALKQLLIIKSRVFRTMFSGKFNESEEKEVVIKDTTFNAFKKFIHFLYFNELLFKDTNDSEIYKIFELLDRYEVLRLNTNDCNQIIISVENITHFIEIAFNFDIENLKTNIMSFINENIDYLYRNNFEDIKDFNDRTDNKLFDVLISNEPKEKSNLAYFRYGQQIISVSKKIMANHFDYLLFTKPPFKWNSSCVKLNTNFHSFKTFIGYIYFKKLIFPTNEDFVKISIDVYELAKKHSKDELMSEITAVLNDITINVENCDLILRFASDYDITDLWTKVLEFIDNNINKWISRGITKLIILFNDKIKYRLLEVLTNNTITADIEHVKFDINGRVLSLIPSIVLCEWHLILMRIGDQEVITLEDTTFEAFQTIVGLLYFGKFLFKYNTGIDFELIREICKLVQSYNWTWLGNHVRHYLESEINLSNFELIYEIAFDYKIKHLIKALNEFREKYDSDYQDTFQLMLG